MAGVDRADKKHTKEITWLHSLWRLSSGIFWFSWVLSGRCWSDSGSEAE